MRQTQKFGTFCMFIVWAAPVAAAAAAQGSCQQIRAACQSAGFAQGAAKSGIGLYVDCINPIMSGTGQRPRARLPLPQVNPQLIAECATSHPRFGRQNAAPTEPISQPLHEPGSSYPNDPAQVNGPGPGVPPPVLEETLRPQMQSARERRDVVSALPPEEQPETGPVKLSSQFRRTEIASQTKEPIDTVIIDSSRGASSNSTLSRLGSGMNIGPEYWIAVICAIIGYAVMSLVSKLRHSSAGNTFDDESMADARSEQSSSTRHQQPQKWFEVLEVPPAASLKEIKAAYRSKISSYHPDRVASLAWEFRKLAEERSKAINEAYNTGTRLRNA
jgi:DnaJ domain